MTFVTPIITLIRIGYGKSKSKMMVYAILPHKWANMLIRVMRFTDKTFGGFIYGKLLDSAIIGILCYFGMAPM